MFTRQVSAARARSAVVKFIWTSFSASAKVAGETSGPTAGPVPKAGGAPGGSCVGSWASSFACSCAPLLEATAAPSKPSEVWVKKCLRDLDMGPPRSIVSECRSQKKSRTYSGERDDAGKLHGGAEKAVRLNEARAWEGRGKALTGRQGEADIGRTTELRFLQLD